MHWLYVTFEKIVRWTQAKLVTRYFYWFFVCPFSRARARVSCNSVFCLKPRSLCSGYTHCSVQAQHPPFGSCTTSPYGGSSLVFCCPGAWEVHQTLESNLATVLFLLYCDISLSGQSDKSHMASPHERTAAASSRCCSADWPWSRKLGFKNSIPVIVYCVLEGKMRF